MVESIGRGGRRVKVGVDEGELVEDSAASPAPTDEPRSTSATLQFPHRTVDLRNLQLHLWPPTHQRVSAAPALPATSNSIPSSIPACFNFCIRYHSTMFGSYPSLCDDPTICFTTYFSTKFNFSNLCLLMGIYTELYS